MAQPIDVAAGAATGPTPRRMTYQEFLRSDYVWAEWVDGEVEEETHMLRMMKPKRVPSRRATYVYWM